MRVLVVEDEELILEFLVRSLKAENKEVHFATDGPTGYFKAANHTYDVIILDVMLPNKSGLEICRDLRKQGNTTPIIFLSARDTESDKIRGLDVGADDYLAKPFSYQELEARLRAVTRRPVSTIGSTLELADVVLSVAKHRVTRGDRVLHLRPKEFALLEYLMRNAGNVMSKNDLLKNVWGVSAENSSNRLEVYIRHLRSKLTRPGEQRLIQTVRGKGYKISAEG